MSNSKKQRKRGETKHIIYLLNKLSKDDIVSSILETSSYKQDSSVIGKRKAFVIKEAIRILTEKFSDLDELILFLRLQYILTKNLERPWNILKIKNAKRFSKSDLSSEKVSVSIRKYFTKYNRKCKVWSEKRDHCMWIVLILGYNKSQPIYCAAHMKLSLVFVSNLKSDYSLFTEKVLRKTFRGSEVVSLTTFTSNADNIQSLNIKSWNILYKKLACHDEKIKSFENIEDNNLNNSQNNINVDPQPEVHDERFEENDVDPQPELHDERFEENEVEEHFENIELPVIENLKYQAFARDLGKKEEDKLIFYSFVNFDGTNVIKGLDKLVEHGIADAPLPDYLYKMPRTGKTQFSLTIS